MKRSMLFSSIPWVSGLVSTVRTVGDSQAAQVTVTVTGMAVADGQIGCSLFKSADGFPMDGIAARQIWLLASRDAVTCTFTEVPDGRYAVSVAHDLNGNKRVDTNFLGMPTEAWGVSGNARPTLRTPTWDEAVFSVDGEARVALQIRVAK